MNRIITGAPVLLLTLFVGIQVAAFVTNVTTRFSLPADIPEPGFKHHGNQTPKAPTGIRVSYIGNRESTLRFLIYNGSKEKLLCLGYSGICASPELLINGLDASAWVCMNGSSILEIMPGNTAEMMVSPEDFAQVPGKSDEVAVGFKSIDDDRPDIYFAEPILIPRAFRNEIRENLST